MSATVAKATRRQIRRAFGDRAVANVAALDTRLRQCEAEIVALRHRLALLEKHLNYYVDRLSTPEQREMALDNR